MDEEEPRPPTTADEYNTLLEVSEDKRLQRLGINPDADQLEIYLELKRRIAARDTAQAKTDDRNSSPLK